MTDWLAAQKRKLFNPKKNEKETTQCESTDAARAA